jgi:lipopolysaccharide heptosyltransferase II
MSDWKSAQRILCIRLDTIGDVIMTAPAMLALKTAHPDRQITLMTSSAGAVAAPLLSLDQLIVYDAPWLKATSPQRSSTPEFEMIEQLRQAQFDAAIIFTVYSQNPLPSAFLCYMAGIPLRLAHCHENPYQLLTHWLPDPEPTQCIRHEVRRQLDLVASTGCDISAFLDDPSYDRQLLRLDSLIVQAVQKRLIQMGLHFDQPWIVIHPGATAPSRRYPPESFAAVAQELAQNHQIQVVFTGTKAENEWIESIRFMIEAPSFSLVDQLTLGELAALLKLAPLLLSNNTAPVHLASAIGTPVVDLYALTNPQHTPWSVPHHVLFHEVSCKFCYKSICPEEHHHCLRLVHPEQVIQAVLSLLEQTRSSSYSNARYSEASNSPKSSNSNALLCPLSLMS